MKHKICRASGLPVKIESIELYRADFQALYDKVMVRFGLNTEEPKSIDEETSKRINWLLERCDKRLLKKYPVIEEIDLPDENAWLALVAQHGPIAVAKDETGSLSFVILDSSGF